MTSRFDQQKFEESKEKVKNKNNQHPAGLQLQAQQSRLAVKADVFQDKKTRGGKEGIAIDERYGGISSVRVDDLMSQTSFGDKEFTEPSALTKCNDDALVDEDAEALKSCLLPVEMRMSIHTGGLLHAD